MFIADWFFVVVVAYFLFFCLPLLLRTNGDVSFWQAHVHHYTQYMEAAQFDESYAALQDLIHDYHTLQQYQQHPSVLGLPRDAASVLPGFV